MHVGNKKNTYNFGREKPYCTDHDNGIRVGYHYNEFTERDWKLQ